MCERPRFKVDENLPVEVAEYLQRAGYDAHTVRGEGFGGMTDVALADLCRRERRVLVTLDLGFADIRAYPPEQYPGLIVFRLRRTDKPYVLERVARLIPYLNRESIAGHLWIVEEGHIRIRGGQT